MPDYFEIEYLPVETKKSGDAIAMRYEVAGRCYVHVVDGGFQDTGTTVVEHIRQYYGNVCVDHAVLSHPDGDHATGLKRVLEEMPVRCLWMLRPWLYAAELLPRFPRMRSVEALVARLKQAYPHVADLEKLAEERGIPIYEPFQGAWIGHFQVLAPSKGRYLDLIVESERTPEADATQKSASQLMAEALRKAVAFIKGVWGDEVFSPNATSAENEMSLVQFARLCGETILLTADAGREALTEAADYAPLAGLALPGVKRFQVPHHGSRRNVSTEVLDRFLGPRLQQPPRDAETTFTALISSAKEDEAHPRKAVVRAMIHRGGRVFATEGSALRTASPSAPARNWGPAPALSYPDDQEAA